MTIRALIHANARLYSARSVAIRLIPTMMAVLTRARSLVILNQHALRAKLRSTPPATAAMISVRPNVQLRAIATAQVTHFHPSAPSNVWVAVTSGRVQSRLRVYQNADSYRMSRQNVSPANQFYAQTIPCQRIPTAMAVTIPVSHSATSISTAC